MPKPSFGAKIPTYNQNAPTGGAGTTNNDQMVQAIAGKPPVNPGQMQQPPVWGNSPAPIMPQQNVNPTPQPSMTQQPTQTAGAGNPFGSFDPNSGMGMGGVPVTNNPSLNMQNIPSAFGGMSVAGGGGAGSPYNGMMAGIMGAG